MYVYVSIGRGRRRRSGGAGHLACARACVAGRGDEWEVSLAPPVAKGTSEQGIQGSVSWAFFVH